MKGKNGLSLHDQAAAVTASLIKHAQETSMSLFKNRFIRFKEMKSGKALLELLIFFLNLWMWYESKDAKKQSFFDSLLFWTRCWLSDDAGAQMNKKATDRFFRLLEERSREYFVFQRAHGTSDAYSFRLSARVLSNMTDQRQSDPLPVMQLWGSIESYMKVIDMIWVKAKSSS